MAMTRSEIDSILDELERELPLLMKDSEDPDDFWMAFAALSDAIEDGADPGYSLFDLSDRLRVRGWQVAAFVDNLADTHVVTNYNWSIDPGDGESRLQRQFTFRPRTIGLTFTYRN